MVNESTKDKSATAKYPTSTSPTGNRETACYVYEMGSLPQYKKIKVLSPWGPRLLVMFSSLCPCYLFVEPCEST